MPSHSKKKTEKKHKTKISQKVIQKVIVKIGDMKRQRKERRNIRKKERMSSLDQPLQIQSAIPANVVYQTGYGAFQPPSTIPSIAAGINIQKPKSIDKNEWIDVGVGTEGIVEILEKPTKKETLDMLGDVVSTDEFPPNANFVSSIIENATQPINSKLYTEQILPNEKVAGNYRFEERQIDSGLSAPTDLIDNNEVFVGEHTEQSGEISEPLIRDYIKYIIIKKSNAKVTKDRKERAKNAIQVMRASGETIEQIREKVLRAKFELENK